MLPASFFVFKVLGCKLSVACQIFVQLRGFSFDFGIQVGWWSGISEDASDPYGRIIHISAEYGRYIARSYSPR